MNIRGLFDRFTYHHTISSHLKVGEAYHVPYIIGLSGLAGSGKDTAAEILQRSLSLYHSVALVRLAQPLYDAATAIFGIDFSQIAREFKEAPMRELEGRSPRHILQTLGTDWGRSMVSQTIWLHAAQRRALRTNKHVVIVPDVRFLDEARWVKDNGSLFHLTRPGVKGMEHASEKMGIPDGAIVIRNAGTIEELAEKIEDGIIPMLRIKIRDHQKYL